MWLCRWMLFREAEDYASGLVYCVLLPSQLLLRHHSATVQGANWYRQAPSFLPLSLAYGYLCTCM